jgi:hypothetical protein
MNHSRMAPIFRRIVAAGLAAIAAITAPGKVTAAEPVAVKREILALYDGAQEGSTENTRIHRFAELPLNHLGFILRFHDVRQELPGPAEMQRYRGVLTWFAGAVPDADSYLAWAVQVSRSNARYVVLGDIGVPITPLNAPIANRWLELSGIRHTGEYIAPTVGTRVIQQDNSLIGFECRLGAPFAEYPVVNAVGEGTRVGLMLETPRHDGNRKTAVVTIGRKGAYAALNYEFCPQRPPLYQGSWLIDPFALFSSAFGAGEQPIPDTTTASGNRLNFNVVNADGWTRASKIENFRDVTAAAGDVMVHELIDPFGALPTTLDLPDDEVRKIGRSSKQTRSMLQHLLAASNVDRLQRRLSTMRSRFDSEFPSISNLSPLVGTGPARTPLAPMSDDADYSKAGATSEAAFSALGDTIAKTESPRRIKPFSLFYHAYAGEYPGLLRSVKDRLQEAASGEYAPISANRYAAIVDGFFSTRIERVGDAAWRISDRGALQTIRFDVDDQRELDMRSSTGVIGSRRIGKSLYLALDETVEPATVVLRPGPALSDRGLVNSRWLVRRVVVGECAIRYEAQGYGDGSFAWEGFTAGRYTIASSQGGKPISQQTVEADNAGILRFSLPASAAEPTEIQIVCGNADSAANQ